MLKTLKTVQLTEQSLYHLITEMPNERFREWIRDNYTLYPNGELYIVKDPAHEGTPKHYRGWYRYENCKLPAILELVDQF